MNNQKQFIMEIIPSIERRKSVVAFSEKLIEEEKLELLFKAAHLAPSSMNIQPWRYIYVTHGSSTYNGVKAALNEGNRKWARNAPVLIISLAQTEYIFNGNKYTNKFAWHDTGMANMLLMLQATEFGLVTHPMGGFDTSLITDILEIPSDYVPVIIIAVGYPGDEKNLEPDLLERQNKPRTRISLSNLVFKDKWPTKE